MKQRSINLALILILLTLTITACSRGAVGAPTNAAAPDVEVQATVDPALAPGFAPPPEIAAARDAAIRYVGTNYPENAPFEGITWAGGNVTPEGLVGSVQYRFQSGGWIIDLSHAVVAPEELEYHVTITQPDAAFTWTGTVTPDGQVIEAAAP